MKKNIIQKRHILIAVIAICSACHINASTQASSDAVASSAAGSALIGIGGAYSSQAVIETGLKAFAIPVYLSGAALTESGDVLKDIGQGSWDATVNGNHNRPKRDKSFNQKRLKHQSKNPTTSNLNYATEHNPLV